MLEPSIQYPFWIKSTNFACRSGRNICLDCRSGRTEHMSGSLVVQNMLVRKQHLRYMHPKHTENFWSLLGRHRHAPIVRVPRLHSNDPSLFENRSETVRNQFEPNTVDHHFGKRAKNVGKLVECVRTQSEWYPNGR